jgi:hypothetical protein
MSIRCATSLIGVLVIVTATATLAEEAQIVVHADQTMHRVSRYLTGACIEDVNHEIYGGLYSQMVFGESFQEPPRVAPIKGFHVYGGRWSVRGEELRFTDNVGAAKVVSDEPPLTDGQVGVEVLLPNRNCSNAGLIVRVNKPGPDVDQFHGYEIALNATSQTVRLGRHRHDWEPIKDTPCAVAVNQWIPLVVKLTGSRIEVSVNGQTVVRHDDADAAIRSGAVGVRQFQSEARYRNLWIETNGHVRPLAFKPVDEAGCEVSGLWRPIRRGTAAGHWTIDRECPFVGKQCQRITFLEADGEIGVENQGLNRWGMSFVAGKPYEGVLWARCEQPCELHAALESRDGSQVHAQQRLAVAAGRWQRLTFALTPDRTDTVGRFAVTLRKPGSVALGYAFLQPGPWGRFKGLPVRRDVTEGLIDQGVTVLRYGGSMVNHAEYRWKKMLGPRDRRPNNPGCWYPYSTNGWGIIDFLDLCQAAGFLAIPAFNMDETPQDMADFVEYVNGPASSVWGRRRAADGHPQPYHLTHMELGNEERVDENYYRRFQAMAEAIWAKDPQMILVVGDFVYSRPIQNPDNFTGAASNITNLAAQRKILELAKRRDREVWFDLHVGTEGPRPDSTLEGTLSFANALDKLADGARHKVVVFELNAGNHGQRRALANALAIQAFERDGRTPVVTSANGLQPDGQNDNAWDQGLLFLNPSKVWLQPPGYVTRMISRNYQPVLVRSDVQSAAGRLEVTARRSDSGETLVLEVVNWGERPLKTAIRLDGFAPSKPTATVEELSGPLDAVNTAEAPRRIVPRRTEWRHAPGGDGGLTFAPYSFTVVRFQ